MSKKRNKSVKEKTASASVVAPSGMYDIAIIGGGASGLACAVACMQQVRLQAHKQDCSNPSLQSYSYKRFPRIVVLESGKRIGASIMRSGNGRCNFSNANLEVSRYHHADFVQKVFSALEANPFAPSVLEWFKQLGLVWKEAPGTGGLLYPFSNKANSVLDVLRYAIDVNGIELCASSTVQAIHTTHTEHTALKAHAAQEIHAAHTVQIGRTEQAKHTVHAEHSACSSARFTVIGETALTQDESVPFAIDAYQVVIASGGITPKTLFSEVKMPYVDPEPLLGPIRTTSSVSLKNLDGIRMQTKLSIPKRSFEEEGEILFRDYGISGIVVFNASRYAQMGDTIVLDFVPQRSMEELTALFEQRIELIGMRKPKDFLTGFVVARLAAVLLQNAGLDKASQITKADAKKLAKACKEFSLTCQGIADERTCQVRRGGVQPSAVNSTTLQINEYPGLFVLGEVLDVDGPCGGYNLHWAWTTGLLAGCALAHNYLRENELRKL